MDGKTIEELSKEEIYEGGDYGYGPLALAMMLLEQRQNSPGIVDDILAATGIYPWDRTIVRFLGEQLEKTGRIDRQSKRYELANYMSPQGEAPVLYIDWVEFKVYDIWGAEMPDLMVYQDKDGKIYPAVVKPKLIVHGEPVGFTLAVYPTGERYPTVDEVRERSSYRMNERREEAVRRLPEVLDIARKRGIKVKFV